jgi:hypothetical protein
MNKQPKTLELAQMWESKAESLQTWVDENDYVELGYRPEGLKREQAEQKETAAELRRLHAVNQELLQACQTFAEWLRREEEGFDLETHNRQTPEGEAAWRKWFYENLDICDLAQKQAKAAIAKAGETK